MRDQLADLKVRDLIYVSSLDSQPSGGFALSRAIAPHTANTHLKNLMAKTHTSRQAELVALLLRAGMGPSGA